jgi:Zn-dependent protease
MPNSLSFDIFQIVVLIYSVVLHELAHGLMARSMGDRTAEHMGRLTLNPLAHLDMFGSVILPIITKLAGGFMFGYAKPVPYDPAQLSDKRFGPAKVAFAGPLVNLALAALGGMAIRLMGDALPPTVLVLVSYVVWINIILAFFNLMPVPPLDGHWLLMTFLPARFYTLKVALYRYQWVLLAVAIFFVFPTLAPLMSGFFTILTGLRLF